MERVSLKKQVYAKSAVDNVINTGFTQLTPLAPSPPETQSVSIDEFFTQYNTLFFDIPKFGPINSHEYLIKTSGEYINASTTNDTVQALIEEITQLRQENLELQRQQIQSDLNSAQQGLTAAQNQLTK